ncbi:sensor histidine kinase [Plebeiibacterium sediminum]|uniref:histidine kinase n=1 Tax=Plebeiibacterium sediminum TaxID=2992112 RepID=A0AAE3SEH0_9BACT|nr:HAMP domain-containing sensor histidine kinase [Plebeiobacterium sediminum]MCW3786463.1 HAMP domain-containing histidine kinase [Plebeiobacterium sediminum]
MEEILNSRILKSDFEKYLGKIFLKNLTLILGIGLGVLFYYMYSDWSVRHNLAAASTRIIPIVLVIVLITIHLVSKQKYYQLKVGLYILFYFAVQMMMYAKCLIHLHEDALAPSVTGVILVIFLLSLDNKQNTIKTVFIYLIPICIFSLLLIFYKKPSSKEFFVLADVFPIAFVGFTVNRIQYKLRFRLFKSNQLLKLEQDKTKLLYKKTLEVNRELERAATEAIIIKEEIQEKNEELNKSNATKDKFLAIIAHDLKNPIGAIWGISDLLVLDRDIDDAEKQHCIEAINDSVKHTHELLENLLNWAQAQNKSIVYNPVVHNAKAVVEKEIKVLQQIADKKSIHIINKVPNNLEVYADCNMLETIIRNLVSNAIKYTYPNGKIIINASIEDRVNKKYTEIVVEDDGVGMNNDKISELFSLSKNVSSKGTNNEAGTGLGLLLCKEFIDLHRGTIHVESEEQKGSVFRFMLPNLN